MSIKNGVLYVVATPIGNLDDVSAHAIKVLGKVDLIAAEDTRHSRTLLSHFGIDARMLSLHEHNEHQAMDKVLAHLQQGKTVALISDAGTPLISDPGFTLVRECHRYGIRVSPIPGPSAVIAALSVSGMASDRFAFEGFPDRNSGARRTGFEQLANEPRTMLFYESSHRVQACLRDMSDIFGADRPAVLARELTKLHETILHGTLGSLCEALEQDPMQCKGEFVLIVGGRVQVQGDGLAPDTEKTMKLLMQELPLKQAAALTAKITGEKKNRLYQYGLQIHGDGA